MRRRLAPPIAYSQTRFDTAVEELEEQAKEVTAGRTGLAQDAEFHSAIAGADIATCPFKVLEASMKHPLTDIGIERFLADWKSRQ